MCNGCSDWLAPPGGIFSLHMYVISRETFPSGGGGVEPIAALSSCVGAATAQGDRT